MGVIVGRAMDTAVVAGSASMPLAKAIAKNLGCPLIEGSKRFPDGECFVSLDDLAGRRVLAVQSTYPDDAYVEHLLLLDAAREAGATHVTSIIPYMGYARQDRAFNPGEAVASRAVAHGVAAMADDVVAIDPHKESILNFYRVPGRAIATTAVPALATTLDEWGVDAILAPDKGARDRAALAASRLGVPFDHLEKTRLGPTEVVIKTKDLDVAGKRVAIVDDMIASGGTMVKAAGQLKEQGASTVYAACTHGLFTGGAIPKLLAGGIDRVLATDTLPTDGCDVVSAAEAVIDAVTTAPRA